MRELGNGCVPRAKRQSIELKAGASSSSDQGNSLDEMKLLKRQEEAIAAARTGEKCQGERKSPTRKGMCLMSKICLQNPEGWNDTRSLKIAFEHAQVCTDCQGYLPGKRSWLWGLVGNCIPRASLSSDQTTSRDEPKPLERHEEVIAVARTKEGCQEDWVRVAKEREEENHRLKREIKILRKEQAYRREMEDAKMAKNTPTS